MNSAFTMPTWGVSIAVGKGKFRNYSSIFSKMVIFTKETNNICKNLKFCFQNSKWAPCSRRCGSETISFFETKTQCDLYFFWCNYISQKLKFYYFCSVTLKFIKEKSYFSYLGIEMFYRTRSKKQKKSILYILEL